MFADLQSRHGQTVSAEFQLSMRQRINAAFETEPLTIAGVAKALATHPGKLCVASGSLPERVNASAKFLFAASMLLSMRPIIPRA